MQATLAYWLRVHVVNQDDSGSRSYICDEFAQLSPDKLYTYMNTL